MGALFLIPLRARRLSFAQLCRFQAALELLTELLTNKSGHIASRVTSVCCFNHICVGVSNELDLIPVDLFL